MKSLKACINPIGFLMLFFVLSGCKLESADINRGFREHRRGHYDQAIVDFNLALKINPKSAEAYVGLAVSWEDKGDNDKAIEYFTKSIELEPKAATYYLRGLVWGKKNDEKKAIEDYTEAIGKDPALVAAYINRAYHYQRVGQLKNAVADYDKVIELTPDDQKAHEAREYVLSELNPV